MRTKGFTLVELLVVISIIAILSIIGLPSFSGVTKNARNSQRKVDIDAISKAYEIHYDSINGYMPLQNSWFSSGKIPTPPEGGNYLGLITSPSLTGYKICTTLEDSSSFCEQSLQITYAPSPTPASSPTPTTSPSSVPTLVVSDTFNRANSATSLGNTDSGQVWTATKGTFGISGNQAYISGGCPAPAYAVVNAGITDATIQVTLSTNTQDVRIPFRYVDLNNMYWLESAGGSYVLNKYSNGVRTQPASTIGATPANGDLINIVFIVANITVYVNEVPRILTSDSSINGTNYGIGTWCATSMRFDDFSVSVTPPPVTLSTNTSYDMKVLVLKYFPLTTNGQNININVTGDVDNPYSTIRQSTIDIDNNLLTDLQKGSSYLLYSNSSAQSSLRYSIVNTIEYTQGVPFDSTYRRPLYSQILNGVNICDYVNNQGVNEVWMWAYQGPTYPGSNYPYLNISESKMSGLFGDISNSYRGNDMPLCNHTYRLYTFNYGRGTAEALHSWGHQIEAEMNAADPNLWSIFQGPHNGRNSGLTTRCGDVHSPPNAAGDYDYANTSPWNSDCLSWTPDGLGALSQISCSNWTCSGDPPRYYLIWMYQNIPGMNNTKTYQGKNLRNWWDIHGDFDNVMSTNRRLTVI